MREETDKIRHIPSNEDIDVDKERVQCSEIVGELAREEENPEVSEENKSFALPIRQSTGKVIRKTWNTRKKKIMRNEGRTVNHIVTIRFLTSLAASFVRTRLSIITLL